MSQAFRKQIAEITKKYREKRGLTREHLSLSLGYDNSYISKLENERINITADKIDNIAKILGIDIKISAKEK